MDKWGRNLSLAALVVLLVLLPFEKGVEATYQGAQVVVLVGFVLRLVGRVDRRFWAVAVAVFVVSMALFTATAAIASHTMQSDFYDYTTREIVRELLKQVGALYFCMTLVFLSQFVFRPGVWTPHDRWMKTILGLAWAFALVVIISAICSTRPFSVGRPTGSLEYVRKFVAPYLLIYMIMVETLYSWRHYRIIITTVYLVGIIVASASATIRYLYIYGGHDTQSEIVRNEWVRVQEMGDQIEIRNQWPFGHHNRLCSYALMVTLFVWLQFFVTRNWELKTLVAISALIPIWCMVVTLTRGGWVALVVGAVGLILMVNWRSVWILLAVAFATWWISPTVVRERLLSVFSPETYTRPSGTFYLRRQIWNRSFEIVRSHPALGLGAGWEVFEEYVKFHYPPLRPDQDTPHAHNNLLEIAVESGLAALVLFVAFTGALVAQVLRAWRATKRQTKPRFVVAGFFGLLISVTVYGLSNYSLRYTIGMLLWICFALMTLLPSITRAIPEEEQAAAPADAT
ncbi:hypothetical protein AMJ85_02300 [candidate division BRC1 bacterium SM23_51]|nr:MAG: hypothetical protein AMJ85_02300 [candidate division BRC1 bacterium SM23_51]